MVGAASYLSPCRSRPPTRSTRSRSSTASLRLSGGGALSSSPPPWAWPRPGAPPTGHHQRQCLERDHRITGRQQHLSSTVNLGSKELIVGGNNASTTFAGIISNTGSVTKTGSGTLTLSAANTYSGATTVSGGELIVDGSIDASAVTVESGAFLSGSGTVGATTINSGGHRPWQFPGNPIYQRGPDVERRRHLRLGDFQSAGPAGRLGRYRCFRPTSPRQSERRQQFQHRPLLPLRHQSRCGRCSRRLGSIGHQFLDHRPHHQWHHRFRCRQLHHQHGRLHRVQQYRHRSFSLALDGNDLKLMFTPGAAPIPEPGTWAAGALLALAAGFAARRRARRNGAGEVGGKDTPALMSLQSGR